MPLISDSPYHPRGWRRSGDLQTIYASAIRRPPEAPARRQRIDTPDGDFLDIDWVVRGHRRAAILCHGLEGDSRRPYMRGMAQALLRRGWDVIAWNYRGCSGEPNRQLRAYHSGFTEDLETVVRCVLASGCESTALVGFSLGGNLVLKYAGERGGGMDPRIQVVAAISAPVNLEACSDRMASGRNAVYMRRFVRSLLVKVREKAKRFPESGIRPADLRGVRTFHDFDGRFTAPWHGFENARHYWKSASSRPQLPGIRVPTLLLTAADDPLLPAECHPLTEAEESDWVHFELTRHGGHCGFLEAGLECYSETRVATFLGAHSDQPCLPQRVS